jgi:hypothetical protein
MDPLSDAYDELNESSASFTGDSARALDTRAGQIIAGIAGVDFSRHVWTRDTDNDFEMNAFDESSMRSWVWKRLLPDVLKVHESRTSTTGLRRMQPLKLGVEVMSVIKAFKTAERVVSKKALSPLVLACALEAVNEICAIQALSNVVTEEQKDLFSCFLRRHPHYSPTFCVYVGYTLLGKQMVQNGSSNTIRKMNQVLLMKNTASGRLRNVLLSAGVYKIKRDFNEAFSSNNDFVEDWKEKWYKAWVTSMNKSKAVIKVEDSDIPIPAIPISYPYGASGNTFVPSVSHTALSTFSPPFQNVYSDISISTGPFRRNSRSVDENMVSIPWD